MGLTSGRLEPAPFRPVTRRLAGLTNSELVLLFRKRAAIVAEDLDGHVLWGSNFHIYWDRMMALQDQLYEIMMEIQSRYPAREITEDYDRTLPVMEPKPNA